MTLQQLTNILQDYAHNGHAQSEVLIEVDGSVVPFPRITVETSGIYNNCVFLRVRAGNEDEVPSENKTKAETYAGR